MTKELPQVDEQEVPLDISHLAELSMNTVKDEDGNSNVDMEQVFTVMSNAHAQRLAIPRSSAFSRKQIVGAFHSAFELIGGVPRLAAWAHTHETEFYKLYARLLPNQAQVDFGNDGVLKIVHSLAPTALDGPREAIEGQSMRMPDDV
jgi:hypothetical protein